MRKILLASLGLAACSPGAGPTPRVAAPARTLGTAETLRVRETLDACGLRRPEATPVLEGVAKDGSVAWSRPLPSLAAWVALDDGGAFLFTLERGIGLSERLRSDGSRAWATTWPQEPDGVAPPRTHTMRPDPRLVFAVAQREGERIVVFQGAPFGGLDLWTFSDNGALARRERVVADGDLALFAGWAHEYVIDGAGGVAMVAPGGGVRSSGRTGHAPSDPSRLPTSQWAQLRRTAGGHDLLVTSEKVSSRDEEGAERWSFSMPERLVEGIAPAWGGVVAVTEHCGLVALDEEGTVRWSRQIDGPFETCPDSASISFDSDEDALVLAWRQGDAVGAGTAAFAVAPDGERLFAKTVEGARGLVPLLDSGVAHLGSCAGDVHIPLPSLTKRGGAPAPPAPPSPEGPWVQEVSFVQHLSRPVDALAVLGPRDVAALVGGHLWRWNGIAWRDTGPVVAPPPAQPPEAGNTFRPFEARQLFAGPRGTLWLSGAREQRLLAPVAGEPIGAGELGALLRAEGGGTFRDVSLLRGVFGLDLGGSSTDRVHLALRPTEAIGCWNTTCDRMVGATVTSIDVPGGWHTLALGTAGGETWALGKTLGRVEGDRLVPLDVPFEPTGRDENDPDEPPRMWGAAPGDLWIADGVLRHFDGKELARATPPVTAPRAVWGTAADDVWVVGDDGVTHFDGSEWAHVVGMGRPTLSLVDGSGPDDVWMAGSSGLYHATRRGPGRRPTPPSLPAAAHEAGQDLVVAATVEGRYVPVALRPRGRDPLARAYELATAGDVLWLRDDAGVVELRSGTATSLRARAAGEAWTCHQCLAPRAPGEGVVLGGAGAWSLEAARWRPLEPRLATMLAVDMGPRGARIAGESDRRGEPATVDVGDGTYDWDLPRGCYVAVDVAGDETWLAGGLRCDATRLERWPAGEGLLVQRSAEGVRWIRAPAGPLLDVLAVGPGEAWAVGVDGSIVHVEGAKVTRMRARSGVRLHGLARRGEEVWIGGDERTLLRLVGTLVEQHTVDALPPRASITSLAFHDGALWVASPDGLVRAAR